MKNSLNVPSLKWGREHEGEATKHYKSVLSGQSGPTNSCILLSHYQIHENLQVEEIGLCICEDKPWYGGSPDAVVFCSCCLCPVMEVKCPFSVRYYF